MTAASIVVTAGGPDCNHRAGSKGGGAYDVKLVNMKT